MSTQGHVEAQREIHKSRFQLPPVLAKSSLTPTPKHSSCGEQYKEWFRSAPHNMNTCPHFWSSEGFIWHQSVWEALKTLWAKGP